MTDNNFVALWDRCLKVIADNIQESTFNAFFLSIRPMKFDGNTLMLGVPSPFVYEYLEKHYIDLLRKVIYHHFGEGTRLTYCVLTDKANKKKQEWESERTSTAVQPKAIVRDGNKVVASQPMPAVQELDSRLNPKYNFENFIEGLSNKLSRTAGEAVAQNPAKTSFNPLFIYGSSGVGKTHLVNAIGTRIKELYPEKRVLYVSAHLFQVQYTNSVRENTVNDFINFYQSIDVLIIDDVQEFAALTKTQNTFFHIFNHLHQTGKQLILTSDRSPVMLQGMEDRLLTRFKWGLIAEMERPNVELRKNILWDKVRRDGLKFPEKVIDFIAENVDESVRDLEGIIISLMAYSTVYNRNVDIEMAERVVRKAVRMVEKKPLDVPDVLEKVCEHYGVDTNAVFSKARKREIVQVRQVAMYLAKKHTEASFAKIGSLIGKRDHATVLHACKIVGAQIEVNKVFRSEIEELENELRRK
ncbi:MAG: chromosomal replication initiator protein DnaA [Bacteroidaceae bacterium]|nr:chromosomal replication initiator protein DnaA [Bacteroidaceae bacterium]MBR3896099.1 chromosomal replication initiator protein DnaA [Bacteroidaceae bacterium]